MLLDTLDQSTREALVAKGLLVQVPAKPEPTPAPHLAKAAQRKSAAAAMRMVANAGGTR